MFQVDLGMISKDYTEQFQISLTSTVLSACSEDYKNALKVFFKYQLK